MPHLSRASVEISVCIRSVRVGPCNTESVDSKCGLCVRSRQLETGFIIRCTMAGNSRLGKPSLVSR